VEGGGGRWRWRWRWRRRREVEGRAQMGPGIGKLEEERVCAAYDEARRRKAAFTEYRPGLLRISISSSIIAIISMGMRETTATATKADTARHTPHVTRNTPLATSHTPHATSHTSPQRREL
jgi:hypothetical protein